MALPVAWQIVEKIRDAFAELEIPIGSADGLSTVATVATVLTVDPVSALDGRSGDEQQAIHAAVREGKFAVELEIGDDDVATAATTNIDSFDFEVGVRARMPEGLCNEHPPAKIAREFAAAVYARVSPLTNAGGKWSGLALRSDWLGGGKASTDPQLSTRIVDVFFRVRYRVQFGDMGVQR